MTTETPEKTRRQTALMKRLAKMRDHKDFEKAMEHVPPTEDGLERAAAHMRTGGLWLAGAMITLLWALSSGGVPQLFFGALAVAAGYRAVRRFLAARELRAQVAATPLVRIPALVADRRSETTPGWLDGRTVYFFRLELEDGNSSEFRYPGRGVQDDLLVKGMTGVAYLRGDTLIAWKTIKV